MNKRLILILLLLCAFNAHAQSNAVLNKDGSFVTGVLTASFDPQAFSSVDADGNPLAVFPFPSSLAFITTTDMTLDIPPTDPDDPDNTGDPRVALSALDGYSTTEKWVTTFADGRYGQYDNTVPGKIDPASVVPGQSVRFFQVTSPNFVVVTGIVRELIPWVDYLAVASGDTVAIIPLKPLPEYSDFMAVLTNDINDLDGNDATPDRTYYLGKSQTPWIDETGSSTYGLFDDATAQGLEQIRQMTGSMEAAAASMGVIPEDIVLAWTAKTESISRTLLTLRAIAQPAPTQIAPMGINTSVVGGLGIADIYMGVITVPYYAGVPSTENPTAPMTEFWKAEPGAYAPPFDELPLDPTSTHVTIANPLPVKTDDQTVPLLITVPNANSGMSKPAAGWPVVIFGHGFTSNRTSALAVADALASIGYAVVAMDFPMHGVNPDEQPELAGFYIENTPFAPIANERTFDVDYVNNTTFTPGPDGLIDPSGVLIVPAALSSMLTGRDTLRQGIADLSTLAVSISSMDIDSDAMPDMDATNMAYVGWSWGAIHGSAFAAIEPLVTRAFLSAPGGGIARMLNASQTFGPIVQSLLAGVGLTPGTADYEQFLITWQTIYESGDPINWSAAAASSIPIMVHEVMGDTVIPNFELTAPLSGTEPIIATMGLDSYSTTQQSPEGLRAAARFLPPATHGSLMSPLLGSAAAFFEMQTQMATFIASGGGLILVTDESTMVPIPVPAAVADVAKDSGAVIEPDPYAGDEGDLQ